MSDGFGNYSFFKHNLERPTIQPNRIVHRTSSDYALNDFRSLSILSPTIESSQQFAGEPLVAGFVPHPPSGPKAKASTPIRFRGKKRLRESSRTSGSEDENQSRKSVTSGIGTSLTHQILSSNTLHNGFHSDPELPSRKHFIRLEPLHGRTSQKDILGSLRTYQSSAKIESSSEPLRVFHDKDVRKLSGDKNTYNSDCDNISDDDSFTNVSYSQDEDCRTLSSSSSSSSESDDELKKKSEEIAENLLSKRYPNATLPSIPKNSTANETTLYENMGGNSSVILSNTYEAIGNINNHHENHLNHSSPDKQLCQSSLLPRVNAEAVRLRKSNFLQEEMNRYFPEHKVSVFVATWNMHEEKSIPGYIDDLLLPEIVDFVPDIYVVGLQESTSLRKEWEIKLQETLGPSHVLMYSSNFGVLHMAVFIRRELVWFCSAVNQSSIATRPGHMIKTKGGLGVSFSLFGTSFLFINSHLTSDEGKVQDRINDYNIIRKSLTLQAVEKPLIDNRPDVTERFDRVFWLGDFNFRVDLKRHVVDNLLKQNQTDQGLKELRLHDQLTNLMNKGEVFSGFMEPEVDFPPTYKYDLNCEEYDTSSKARVPSWTDRILFKSTDKDAIKSTCYKACSSVTISDHRPVYGIYEVILKPCKKSIPLTGGQFVRDVYIEANRRRSTINPRNQKDSSVCIIL